MNDLISRQAAIELANSLKDDLPDDERIADTVMAHNEGILEYQTKLSLLPSAQPGIIRCKDCKYYTSVTAQCEIRGKGLYLIRGLDDFCSKAERRPDE